ncbi:MAG: R3H domain-containing nucleic acid-binding protein [Candidatus Azambacteria bacterium]|nr:R3H domain-containing nucleic acid-binding protein [Candidatus Azambacteria bacterium]
MTEEKLIQLKKVIGDFFAKTGITNFEIKNIEIGDQSLSVSVLADDASLCIGEGGKNISAFETLLRLVVKKQLDCAPHLHLDINNYRGVKDELIRELAKKTARRARFYKQPVALEAMSAYDRRIIHTELAAHPDIKTESVGEGTQRRVVVKFII